MALFRFVVPVISVLVWLRAVYQVFTNKLDAGKMGLTKPTLNMFGVCNFLMAICWGLVLFGLWSGSLWTKPLASFATGMSVFDYIVSLPPFKDMGDNLFKYYGGVFTILQIAYCVWL